MATTQKRSDSYKITVSCGYDINGKQIRRTTTWTPEPGMTARQIEKELERQKVFFEEKCRTGKVLDGSIRFAEFAERWFDDYAEKQLRPRTLARYQALMPRINAAIGHIRLDRLQPHHLMAFYDNLCEEGVRADTKYLPCLDLREHLSNLKMTQAQLAEQAGLAVITLRNVYRSKSISGQSANKIASALNVPVNTLFIPCSDDQTLSAETERYHHSVISSILSSAVKWQVILANPCDRADLPKSERHEAHYLDEIETANLHPDTISTWFRNFVKRPNLPHVTVHSLRHTNATLLIAAGTNLQTDANRLGHANTTTTSKIYFHAIKSVDAAAAETLNDLLNPITKKA